MSGVAKPRLVLVVDDDQTVRRLVRAVLEVDQFEVVEARDGDGALHLASERHPSAVVLDLMRPGLDGVDVCRRLDHDRVKVVVLTAHDDPDLEAQAREAGADAFMTKPFAPMDLLDLIAELVAA
jgi:DNA-binding response OmpR family regulator